MKTFKRALSSILAFVMVLTTVVITNTATTFAAASEYYAEWTFNNVSSTNLAGSDVTLDSTARIKLIDPSTSQNITTNPEIYYSRDTASKNANSSSSFSGTGSYTTYSGSTVSSSIKGWKMSANANYGYQFVVDPKLSENNASSYNIKFVFFGNSSNVSTLKVVSVDGLEFGKVKDGTAIDEGTASGNTDLKELQINNLTGYISFGFNAQPGLAYVGIEYNTSEPSVSLSANALDILAGNTQQLEATVVNLEGATVTWSVKDGGSSNISVSNDGTITVAEGAAVGETATIVATATDGTTTVTAECVVNVVAPTKDVVIKGCAGIKSLTLTNQADNTVTYTVNWDRSGGNEASLNDALGADYNQTDNKRSYLRTIKEVPLGTYDVTYTGVTEYWSVSLDKTVLTVDSASAYSSSAPAVTASSSKVENGAAGGFDYVGVGAKGDPNLTWDFNTKTGAANEYLNLQGISDYGVYTKSYTDGYYMTVDTTSGKFNSIDRAGDIQVNTGTKFTIYATPNTTVTFYNSSNAAFTSFDCENCELDSTTNAYKYTGTENGSMTLTVSNGGYLSKIVATYPEQPIVQTTTDGTQVGVWANTKTNMYYVACVVKADELTAHDKVAPAYNGTALNGTESGTVYKAAEFENNTYTAQDFGGAEADYIYVVGIKGGEYDANNVLSVIKSFTRLFIENSAE